MSRPQRWALSRRPDSAVVVPDNTLNTFWQTIGYDLTRGEGFGRRRREVPCQPAPAAAHCVLVVAGPCRCSVTACRTITCPRGIGSKGSWGFRALWSQVALRMSHGLWWVCILFSYFWLYSVWQQLFEMPPFSSRPGACRRHAPGLTLHGSYSGVVRKNRTRSGSGGLSLGWGWSAP